MHLPRPTFETSCGILWHDENIQGGQNSCCFSPEGQICVKNVDRDQVVWMSFELAEKLV